MPIMMRNCFSKQEPDDNLSVPKQELHKNNSKNNHNHNHKEELEQTQSSLSCQPRTEQTMILLGRQNTFESVTDDVLDDLRFQSVFFSNHTARSMPSFSPEDLQVGALLGQGVFGAVYEIERIWKDDSYCCCEDSVSFSDDDFDLIEETSSHTEEDDEMDAVVTSEYTHSLYRSDKQEYQCRMIKSFMIKYPNYDNSNHPRYAVKVLRPDIRADLRSDGIIDMACEAELLSRLSHPNIIKLRGTVGTLGSSSFMLITDRLEQTLSDKIDEWRRCTSRNRVNKNVARFQLRRPSQFFFRRKSNRHRHHHNSEEVRQPGNHPAERRHFMLLQEQLRAARQIASALQYLHRKKLVFRDMKPDNVGLDHDNQWRLFDFGLCKELKEKDLIRPPDGYRTSGVVGSRRYMAPEVARNLPYGFSADAYSFGILLWELVSLETPFAGLDTNQHFDFVVVRGKRPPPIHRLIPDSLHDMMEHCWAENPLDRPRLDSICDVLLRSWSSLHSSSYQQQP